MAIDSSRCAQLKMITRPNASGSNTLLIKSPSRAEGVGSRVKLVGPVPELQQERSYEPICVGFEICKRPGQARFLHEHTFLKRRPAMMTCPNCLRGVETIVERHSTLTTHLAALLLIPCCMCLLPYCSSMLRDAIHRCPSCGISLGSRFASATEAFVICFSERDTSLPNLASENNFL